MKRISTILAALLVSVTAFAQSAGTLEKPSVDRNVELMSIVWRLAGNPEYNATFFKEYTDRIEEHFGEYRDHPLIEFARSIRAENGISFDAVASMAIHLDDDLNLKQDIATGSLEGRWANVDKERFTTLLKRFAADTRFDEFFAAGTDLYAEASSRFLPVYEAIDAEWFARFFGTEPKETFVIVNGLGNGGDNYGVSAEYSDGRKEAYAIMGAWSVDEEGMVIFPLEDYLPTLIHEFSHSFVNSLTAAHREEFRESGERLYDVFGEWMSMQAYSNWETMLNEALIRAVVIKYFADHGATQEQLATMIRSENSLGFAWTKPLVEELQKYSTAHEEYPTLDDYMPRLAEAYTGWADMLTTDEMKATIAEAVATIRTQRGGN